MKRTTPEHTGGTGRRRLRALGLAMAGLVVTGACTADSSTKSFPFEAGSTTTSTSTSTSTPATTSTSVPRATTTTTGASGTPATTRTTSRPAQGEPRVIASPPGAVPESRVSITGDGFTAAHWRTPNAPLWLAGGPSGCDFFADADADVTVTPAGHLQGSFAVPSHGACRQSSTGEGPVLAGTYRIVYQCTACTIGQFEVTASAPPTVDCQDVGFTPNSDDVVADIVAYGLPCSEAEAVVRKVAKPLGPVNGAPRGEAEGFTCVRTSQSDGGMGLPSAEYECTRGSQRITFTRL